MDSFKKYVESTQIQMPAQQQQSPPQVQQPDTLTTRNTQVGQPERKVKFQDLNLSLMKQGALINGRPVTMTSLGQHFGTMLNGKYAQYASRIHANTLIPQRVTDEIMQSLGVRPNQASSGVQNWIG